MNQNATLGVLLGFLGFLCVLVIAILVAVVFFILTLQTALSRCSRRNRTMEPAMAWLNLVPLFSLFWAFITASKIAESLKREFADREIDDGSDYGKNIGLAWAATGVAGAIISWSFLAVDLIQGQELGAGPSQGIGNLVSAPFSIASLVLLIIYWVKIAGYSRTLDQDDRHGDDRRDRLRDDRYRDDDEDDDIDDSPRTRPAPDDRIR